VKYMAYFEDLSEYGYHGAPPINRFSKEIAVGWLDQEHDFYKAPPAEELLDLIWTYCKVSIAQTRGLHECELCIPPKIVHATRHGESLELGSSEIRVFSDGGPIYAAPTLIYHYVRTHHYKPPDEFLRALRETTGPPAQEYFEQLKKFELDWQETLTPPLNPKMYRTEKISGEVRRVEVPYPVCLDES